MRRLLVGLVVVLAACGDSTGPGVDLTDPSQLVGSYHLAVYQAGGQNNPGGSLELRSDSTFSMNVNAPQWSSVRGGTWTWNGNVVLKPINVSGSIVSNGLGFTNVEYPALFFRKN